MATQIAPSVTIVGVPLKTLSSFLSDRYEIRYSEPKQPCLQGDGEIYIYETHSSSSDNMEKLQKQNQELSEQLASALKSIQTFHHQQQALFDEFVLLREKYDGQKSSLVSTLWTVCGESHPDLKYIPKEEAPGFEENDQKVGSYRIGDVLGEGQFATVCDCYKGSSDPPMAIKMIKKERITSFPSLKRISTEIATLKTLAHCEHIVTILDVLQTASNLYIVTEKGGTDLFEFFDEHAEGVSESWAVEIISGVMRAVLFCHQHKICHRDLKPENILLKFDVDTGKCLDLKLCDFGLSTEFEKKVPLSDFCGSPGFFAPEMLSLGNYYGDKADVWSTGCILLELVLGHEGFCNLWMVAYDYSVMQDRDHFMDEIRGAVKKLPAELNFSAELNDIIIQFLCLDYACRPSISKLCTHDWLGDRFAVLREEREQGAVTPVPLSPAHALEQKDGPLVISTHQSLRERRFFSTPGVDVDKDAHLPPIEPPTPNVGKARKMLISNGYQDNSRSPKISPAPSPLVVRTSSSHSVGDLKAVAVARLNVLQESDDEETFQPPKSR